MSELTTLANVKGWLNITSADAARDVTLSRLIAAQSRFIETTLSRKIQSQSYTEVRNGSGAGAGRFMMTFGNDPVSAVSDFTINGLSVPASPDGGVLQPGYGFDAEQIWIAPTGGSYRGNYQFSRGSRNVSLTYTAGFLVLPYGQPNEHNWFLPAEQQVIPASPFQIVPEMMWLSDNGVCFAPSGTALVKVAGAPALGQYSISAIDGTPATYTFNSGDVGKTVAISYSYVPPDIEQACIELVSLRWKERDRIGIVSLAVGTESTSYFQKEMQAQVALDLQQYQKVFDV